MDEPVSIKLKRLLEHTQLFLASYNNKKQWPTFYPLVCKLAEQYRTLYKQNPSALQAQLMLYKTQYDFATNLVINQCILTTALCVSQNYDDELSELYISASLIEHLCVGAQLNKLSKQIAFTSTESQIWQLRHKLAARVLLTAKQPAHSITQVLAKLSKYKHALVSTPKIMLYDGGTIIVALANILAVNLTCNAANQQINFYKAIADLYLRTPNLFAQRLLKSLIAHIGPLLPGSRVLYAEQAMIYLATDAEQRHILIKSLKNKIVWYRVKATLNDNAVQWLCADKRILYKVWDTEYVNIKAATPSTQNTLYDLIGLIKLQQEYSFNNINTLLAPHPNVIKSLCQAVKPYNKEHQAAKNLTHSLSMVGYNNAPAIIQRVVFEQLVFAIPHPLHAFLVNRLKCMVDIMRLLVYNNKQYQFEHICLPLYAYAHYLLIHCSTQLSRKTPIAHAPNKSSDTPMCAFFGIESMDSKHLNQQLSALLSDNPWTFALLDAEQVAKNELTEQSKLWVAFKVVAQSVFKPKTALTPWQQQTLKQQLIAQGWDNQADFYDKLQTLALFDSI